MERLGFKEAGAGLLTLAMLAGCSTNVTVNTVKEPEAKAPALKAAEVKTIDLGDKNGASIKVNLRLTEKKKFDVKNDFPTNTSIFPLATGSHLTLKLYRQPAGSAPISPKARFEGPNTTGTSDTGNVFTYILPDPGPLNTVVYKGLQEGFDYYISARVFTPNYYNTSAYSITFTDDGTGDGAGAGTLKASVAGASGPVSYDLTRFLLNPTDEFLIDGNYFGEITTPPSGPNFDTISFKFLSDPNIGGVPVQLAQTGTFTHFVRNMVGVGDIGFLGTSNQGMANNNSSAGGGTAPGFVSPIVCPTLNCEEYVSFTSHQISVTNDDTFGNTTSAAQPNGSWDMEINLMASLAADVSGNVKINPGSGPVNGPEQITP
jgi:hypothetical protein